MVWYYYAVPAVLLRVKRKVCSITPGQVIIVERKQILEHSRKAAKLALTYVYRAKLGIDSV